MIEETLGVQLFSRENRQTLPTAIGLTVIEQARTMLGALETIRSTVDSTKDIQRGTIRLASFPMVLATFLPPLLRQFNRLYPGIQVVALEVSDDEVETLLGAGAGADESAGREMTHTEAEPILSSILAD